MGALGRADGGAILAMARDLADKIGAVRDDWNGFAVRIPRRPASGRSISAWCRARRT